jgi:hypothetical protein
MADKDVLAFGLTRAQRMAEEDENAACMIPLNTKDRGTPYEPVGPPAPVRRGATCEGCSDFIRRAEDACRRLCERN